MDAGSGASTLHMSIRRSAAPEIQALMAALASPDEVKRESAVARLAIVGERAVDRLTAGYASASHNARVGILRALEAIADPRAIGLARQALSDGGDLAVSAVPVLRALLDTPDDATASHALDALVGAALNPAGERRLRVAAFEALSGLPEAVRAPVAAVIQRELGPAALVPGRGADALWEDAVNGRLPGDPALLREAVTARAPNAPLAVLQKMIDAVRAREHDAPAAGTPESWRQVRGALHQALALRGSRIAVYDLRETLAASKEPLPASFLAAVQVVGDESCLEPIAIAWSKVPDEAARRQLTGAFEAITKREKITRRSAVLKRIATRWPGLRA